ncbi:MAG TPA: 2-isopropylmalate synthase [Methanomassiliicoccales archaeon]|nr:2-isopropylmalate synthase [Methanomassiliicoccales archaeon]
MEDLQTNSGKTERPGKRREIDRRRIFTSDYNSEILLDSMPESVMIFDTTLRDGEQTPGIALSLDEKVMIAGALNGLGVDVIEAGFPRASDGEREAVRRIHSLGLESAVCGLARSRREDVDAVLDCGLDYIHTFIATSDTHLKYKLKMNREQVMASAVDAIEYSKDHGLTVEFSCEDATRTSIDFLKEMHIAVQEAGADKINVPDTVGVISPPAMERLIGELMTVTRVPISVHCHDDFGLAVANSLSAVRAGARQVHVCVNGLGERSGNAALEEVAMGLMAFFNIPTNLETSKIGPVCKTVSRVTGYPIPNNKSIVGANAFAHESGIHVHGVLGDPSTYEAFGPELVGMDRSIVMGKHTGAHSVNEKLGKYGLHPNEMQLGEIVRKVKGLSESGKEIDDAELVAIAYHVQGRRPDECKRIDLKECSVLTGMNITPTAVVAIDVDGEIRRGSEIGVGPIDAVLKAIRAVVSEKISLKEYSLSAITGGSDSLCEVIIKVQYNGDHAVMSVGKAVGSDIVQTSVDAAVEAIDRLYSVKDMR